ncbi:MAG: DUF308 domain-containing protein, partial [Enterococcus sp.]|nr:DUF308 domain-containing protein [Enterococcus sp.]
YYFITFPIVIPTVIGIWFIVLGIFRLAGRSALTDLFPGFGKVVFWTGLIMILLGILLVLHPLFASLTIVYFLAISFIYQGVVYFIETLKK